MNQWGFKPEFVVKGRGLRQKLISRFPFESRENLLRAVNLVSKKGGLFSEMRFWGGVGMWKGRVAMSSEHLNKL